MSKSDILAAMKEVEGQILSWNQNIRESMKYIESRFADFHSKAISDNSSCGSIKPHFLHLKPQFSSQTAAATIPNSSLSPPLSFNSPQPLPKNNPAPPKQTSSQPSFEELIKKIEAKIVANALTPPPQPEPSDDTQVVTTATSVTGLWTIFQEEQLATKIVEVSVNPCETKKIACAPEMRGVRYVHKVFDELTEMGSSSPKEVAASGALRKNSYIFIEEKKAGDSSTDKIGHISIHRELSLAGGEKIQVYMNEKWANLHIAPAAAALTDYFEKKGIETLRVFDPGGSAFDARVREAGLFVCLRCYLSAVIICMTWLLPQWVGGTIGVDIAILQLLNLKGIQKLSVQEVTVGDKIDDGWFLELGMTAASLVEQRGHYSTIHLEDKVVLKVCGVIRLGMGETSSRNRGNILFLLAIGPAPDHPNPWQPKSMAQISIAH